MRRLINKTWRAILEALRLEGCMVCRFGVAHHSNEITLRGHIGVIGLRCNACQHKYDARQFRLELIA